jgi:hypothetical protein
MSGAPLPAMEATEGGRSSNPQGHTSSTGVRVPGRVVRREPPVVETLVRAAAAASGGGGCENSRRWPKEVFDAVAQLVPNTL